MKHYKMVDDCIVLLSYCSKHHGEYQSFRTLEEATGIPLITLWHIIEGALQNKTQSLLWSVARQYGYWFVVYRAHQWTTGPVIDVTYQGCLQCNETPTMDE